MTTKSMSSNTESNCLAQVLVPTRDVAKDIDFFKERFGFKLLNIFPDDDPQVAVLFGHGLHLRLDRKIGKYQLSNPKNEKSGKKKNPRMLTFVTYGRQRDIEIKR